MNFNNLFNNKKESNNYLLKGGMIIDPNEKIVKKKDILIKGKIISKISEEIVCELTVMVYTFVRVSLI